MIIPRVSAGIYHLMKGGSVLYVGASSRLFARIGNWHGTAVPFDSVQFFPCSIESLPTEELSHIERYSPPMNKSGITTPYHGAGWKRGIFVGIRWYPNAAAYLNSIDPDVLNVTQLRNAEIADNLKTAIILTECFGFPEPVRLTYTKNESLHRAIWRRDEVIEWVSHEQT